MPLELDHLFICTDAEAPETEALKAFGLTEGLRRPHPGQGTTNVCFFFENAYLELVWACDRDEIQSEVVRPTGLGERCDWKETGACPFGIGLRRTPFGFRELPFSTWNYRAPFLPPDFAIPIAANSLNSLEPLIFLPVGARKPVNYPPEKRPPLTHQRELKEITGVRMTLPREGAFSPEVRALMDVRVVDFIRGDRYHLELEFNNTPESSLYSFDPVLPLSLRL